MSFSRCGAEAVRSGEDGLVFAAGGLIDLVHALWLIAIFSLVYAATRHEQIAAVLNHSWRFGAKVTAVLTAFLGVLAWMSWRL